jgi:predicted transcriptional regulator
VSYLEIDEVIEAMNLLSTPTDFVYKALVSFTVFRSYKTILALPTKEFSQSSTRDIILHQ